jgi:hypothetical protein
MPKFLDLSSLDNTGSIAQCLSDEHLTIVNADVVGIQIDRRTNRVWVCVDGVSVFRAQTHPGGIIELSKVHS